MSVLAFDIYIYIYVVPIHLLSVCHGRVRVAVCFACGVSRMINTFNLLLNELDDRVILLFIIYSPFRHLIRKITLKTLLK